MVVLYRKYIKNEGENFEEDNLDDFRGNNLR